MTPYSRLRECQSFIVLAIAVLVPECLLVLYVPENREHILALDMLQI